MTESEIGDLIAELAGRYEWKISGTQALWLRAAIAPHTRLKVTDTADRLNRTLRRRLTAAQLADALNKLNQATAAGAPVIADDGAATVGPISGIPYHLPTCQCGGTGLLDGAVAGTLGARPETRRTYEGTKTCGANQGRRITPERWAQYLEEDGHRRNLAGRPVESDDPTGKAAERLQILRALRARHGMERKPDGDDAA